MNRRSFLAGLMAAPLTAPPLSAAPLAAANSTDEVSAQDRSFLEEMEHRIFLYFWEQANAETGLVPDRAGVNGGPPHGPSAFVGSCAATGFGLSALCIGAQRGWITSEQARKRITVTLDFFTNHAPQEHGWFFHWMDIRTGERRWNSEASSIDTALFLAGVLTAAGQFSKDEALVKAAQSLYDRVDFPWMLNGDPFLLSHGWRPETGFIKFRWEAYAELTILYLLGIGSATLPIVPAAWYAWKRPFYTYGPYKFISGGPLFTHQYSQAWIDFRGRRDRGFIDFFRNSIAATRANRLYCQNLAQRFPLSFSDGVWGITASDSARGYKIYGELERFEPVDGTVAPCAAGGSLMLTPDISLPALKEIRERFGDGVYGRYGFVDALNPTVKWYDSDVIGIDAGITLLSSENLLTGKVWSWFMANEAIPRAMNLIGFYPPVLTEPEPPPPEPAQKKSPPRRHRRTTRRASKL